MTPGTPEGRRYYASLDGSATPLVVREDDDGIASAEGATVRHLEGGERVFVTLGERSAVAFAERRDGAWHVELEGRAYTVRVDDERTHELRALTEEMAPTDGVTELRAPMPGLVLEVRVEEGDEVAAGEGIVVMEAMKMENELEAKRAGVVSGVHVREGETVDRDAVLVTLGPSVAADDEGTASGSGGGEGDGDGEGRGGTKSAEADHAPREST